MGNRYKKNLFKLEDEKVVGFLKFIFQRLWAFSLKCVGFNLYIRLKTIGSFKDLAQKHPKLILISNHSSHLDAVCLSAAIPFKLWNRFKITAAKDYWFGNKIIRFFSRHCLGALPIDRKASPGDTINSVNSIIQSKEKIWLLVFPEGTRSLDGKIKGFKRGVSLFSKGSNTGILFLYIEGNNKLWPKGNRLPYPGVLKIHIGPIQPPAEIDEIHANYKKWVLKVDPDAQFSEPTAD